MSEAASCPKCSSQKVQAEDRLRNPSGTYSLGVWRISYGYVSVAIVFVVGLLALVSGLTWLSEDFLEEAIILAALCLIFVLWVGTFTWRMSRWPRFTEYRCQQCGERWSESAA